VPASLIVVEALGTDTLSAPCSPHVGDEVTLRHSAIVGNINNVLRKGVLQPDEIGVVLKEDPDSTTMNVRCVPTNLSAVVLTFFCWVDLQFEVKNTTPGSERNGQVG
jgi:hypothetical protein